MYANHADRTNLGGLLRQYRRSRDIDIREFAKELGFSRATMARIESGRPMSQANMLKVLQWLFRKEPR